MSNTQVKYIDRQSWHRRLLMTGGNQLAGWRLGTLLIALIVMTPIMVVLSSVLRPDVEIWRHLVDNMLFELVRNTFWLAIGVSGVAMLLGVSLGWLTAACEYPMRRVFSWALLLPLAVPTYVLAFTFLGIFDFAGPVQALLDKLPLANGLSLPDMRSRAGVVLVMSLALYPYVYLLARDAFMSEGRTAAEAAATLGYGRVHGFFRVALPMARPWIAGGVMLVMMETLSDFGAVSIFNYDTFTTAIYQAWFGFFSLKAASQLSSLLVVMVFIIIVFEQRMRRRMRYTQGGRNVAPSQRIQLTGARAWTAFGFSALILTVAFIIPVVQLGVWASEVAATEFDSRYLSAAIRSFLLGVMGAALIGMVSLYLAYARRLRPGGVDGLLVRLSTLGYALPGTVLAVGVFIPVAQLDNWLDGAMVLKGTVPVLLLAYMVRFMAVGFNSVDSAMQRVTRSLDDSARLFGLKGIQVLRRVHFPMLRGGIVTACTLALVDIMKEMPITLMMRPFGWDTLAVKVYELTSEGEWERAALPALALILIGILPVILLTRHGEKNEKRN